ncbi:MAG: RHS repeat protein, partial [Spirochaetales bacterium]|nr:RHS repeat protein [Spirochaetales bacterium]
MKNTVKIIIVLIMVLYPVCSAVADQYGPDTVSDSWLDYLSAIESAGNNSGSHPVELSCDGDEGTWFGVQAFAADAEISLEFNQDVMLDGLRICGYLPQDSVLYLQYRKNGETYDVPAAMLAELDGTRFLDLSRDRRKLDNLIIRVHGSNLSDLRINEFSLVLNDTEGELHKKALVTGYVPLIGKYKEEKDILIDGKIGTEWHSDRATLKAILDWFDADQHGAMKRFLDKSKTTAFIYSVANPGDMRFFKYFLTDNAEGSLSLYVFSDNQWKFVRKNTLTGNSGWQKIYLNTFADIKFIKIELSNPSVHARKWSYGGIGEIEIWSRSGRKTSAVKGLVSPADQSDDALFDFPQWDNRDYILKVCYKTENEQNAPEIFLNGHPVEEEILFGSTDITSREYIIPSQFLKLSNNKLEVDFPGNGTLLGAYLIRRDNEQALLSEPSLSDGIRYSGRETSTENGEYLLADGISDLEEIILHYNDQAPGNPYTELNGVKTWLSDFSQLDHARSYLYKGPIDRIGLEPEGSIQEINVKASPDQILNPFIELLYPLDQINVEVQYPIHFMIVGITDSPDGTILVNGVPAAVCDNFFWISSEELGITTFGQHTVNAEITAADGKTASDEASFLVTSELNTIIIDQGEEIHNTRNPDFLFSGHIEPNFGQLYINGQQAAMSGVYFSETVPLEEGLNRVVFELHGIQEGSILDMQERYVYYREGDPYLAVTSPVDEEQVNSSALTVTGRVSPWGLAGVTANGIQGTVKGSSFRVMGVPLQTGENSIIVNAQYDDGESVTVSLTVYNDQTGPQLSDILPEPGTKIASSSIAVSGTVTDTGQATVIVNGVTASVSGSYFEAVVPAANEGFNTISIKARDQAGNESYWPDFNIYCDWTGPEVVDITLNPSGWTNDRRPVLSFAASDTISGIGMYQVSVNGGDFVTKESPWQLPFLPDGEIPVTVRAFDTLGNFTDGTVVARIDTLKPDTAENYRAVPGLERAVIRWEESDDETESYLLGCESDDVLVEAFREGLAETRDGRDYLEFVWEAQTGDSVTGAEMIDPLSAGTEYTFYIQAVDRAGNIGDKIFSTITTGQSSTEPELNGTMTLEYDNVTMLFPRESVDEEMQKIRLREVTGNTYSKMRSQRDLVSPVYSFAVETDEGVQDSYQFPSHFTGSIRYRQEDVPANVPEEHLAVFYYDEAWEQWFVTDSDIINTETNTIYFAADHFTDFSVQPTDTEVIDYRDWQGIEYPLESKTVKHSPFTINPQNGSMTTAMTEFVLPGTNGLDLAIRRVYSTTVADSDSAVRPEYIEKYYESGSKYAYSLGQGWKLDFPYFTAHDEEVLIKTPGGNFLSSKELSGGAVANQSSVTYTDTLNRECTITILKDQVFDNDVEGGSYWKTAGVTLRTTDGTVYTFNENGFIDTIVDVYGNTIRFGYVNGMLNHITDTRGRIVSFAYTTFNYFDGAISLISGISVAGSDLNVFYNHTQSESDSYPCLDNATDVGGRNWKYYYIDYHVQTIGGYEVPSGYPRDIRDQYMSLLANMDGPGIGNELVSFGKEIKTIEDTNRDLLDMNAGLDPDALLDVKMEAMAAWKVQSLAKKGAGGIGVIGNAEVQDVLKTREYTYEEKFEDDLHLSFLTYPKEKYLGSDSHEAIKQTEEVWDLYDLKKTTITTVNSAAKNVLCEEHYYVSRPFSKSFGVFPYQSNVTGGLAYSVVERAVKTYFYENDEKVLKREKVNKYDYSINKPVLIRNASGSAERTTEATYKYDSWGNPLEIKTKEKNTDYTNTKTVWNWCLSDPVIDLGIVPSDKPFNFDDVPAATLKGKGIMNFLRRSYTHYESDQKGIEQTPDEEKVFEYNENGKITGIAVRAKNNNGQDVWAITALDYYSTGNTKGELHIKIDPVGLKTVFTYYEDENFTDEDGTIYGPYRKTKIMEIPDEATAADLFYSHVDDPADLPDTGIKTRYSYTYADPITGDIRVSVKPDNKAVLYESDSLGRITSIIQPKNEGETENPETSIDYDDTNMQVTQTDPLGNYTVYQFEYRGNIYSISKYDKYNVRMQKTDLRHDEFGRLNRVDDPKNNSTDYSYDAFGRILSESYTEQLSSDGPEEALSVTFAYDDALGTLTRTNEKNIKTVSYLDAGGRTMRVCELDESGNALRETSTTYNAKGLPAVKTDARKKKTEYKYNRNGDVTEIISPRADYYHREHLYEGWNQVARISYNITNKPEIEELVLSNGNAETTVSTKYKAYDLLGRPSIESVVYDSWDFDQWNDSDSTYTKIGQNSRITHFYNITDREIYTCDPSGNYFRKDYTVRGKIERETDALGHVTSYEYDEKDRLESMTGPLENSRKYDTLDETITYHYDALDRMFRAELPGYTAANTKYVQFDYDANGNVEYRREADGSYTHYEYSNRNRVLRETYQINKTNTGTHYITSYTYDKTGNLVEKDLPGNDAVSYGYDALNRKTSETLPDTSEIIYAYDLNNNLVSRRNGLSFFEYFTYDALNRQVSYTDAEKGVWNYIYHPLGGITKTEDPNDTVTEVQYDQRGSIIKETDGRGNISWYAYDLNGNLETKKDPRGTTIRYTYSAVNLPLTVGYTNSSSSHDISYTYDEAGNIMLADDNEVTTYYNRDASDNYVPDPMGLIKRTETYAGSSYGDVAYDYDNMNRMKSLQNGSYDIINYNYNHLGQLTGIAGGNGTSYFSAGTADSYNA